MSIIPHWELDGHVWDRLVLGGVTMPGVWRVQGGVRRRIDVKLIRGSDAARLKDEGYEPARLDLVTRMLEVDDWIRLQQILPTLHPKKKGGIRNPLSIYHPATQLLNVDSVYIDEIDAPQLDDGILELTLRAIEWVPQPVRKKKAPEVVQKGSDVPEDEVSPEPLDKVTNVR